MTIKWIEKRKTYSKVALKFTQDCALHARSKINVQKYINSIATTLYHYYDFGDMNKTKFHQEQYSFQNWIRLNLINLFH